MLNATYFDTLDSEQKAYWLGFFCADGHLYKSGKQVSILLGGRDKAHLEKFAALFGGKVLETQVFDSRTEKTYTSVRCALSSKYLHLAIQNKGIPQQKSKELGGRVFDYLTEPILNHFVRGYFDGDGCISKIGIAEYRLTFVGPGEFLDHLADLIAKEVAIKRPNINFSSGVHCITWIGLDRINLIKTWLYADATVFLERKKAIFDQIPPYRGSSRYKGVYWIKARRKWVARIYTAGKMRTIGEFATEQEAADALVSLSSLVSH